MVLREKKIKLIPEVISVLIKSSSAMFQSMAKEGKIENFDCLSMV